MPDNAIRRKNDGTLGRSYLIQRLKKPFQGGDTFDSILNAFAFGGGLLNGGLSKDAMGLLQDIFRFDYMGSAEFEWGAVPAALQYIAANANDYTSFAVPVMLSTVPAAGYNDKSKGSGLAEVFVIAQKGDQDEYTARIQKWASETFQSDMKESTHLSRTLRPKDDYDSETQGWLDLNNGVFFFTDKEMFLKTAKLFGVDTEQTV